MPNQLRFFDALNQPVAPQGNPAHHVPQGQANPALHNLVHGQANPAHLDAPQPQPAPQHGLQPRVIRR